MFKVTKAFSIYIACAWLSWRQFNTTLKWWFCVWDNISQHGYHLSFWRYSVLAKKLKMIETWSKPYKCCIPMTYGNFIINMACQLMSLTPCERNMAFSLEVAMTNGKLLCIVGTLVLLPCTNCGKRHWFLVNTTLSQF